MGVLDLAVPVSLGVMEFSNASGTIVCIPTGGSSGIVPGAICGAAVHPGPDEDRKVKALLAAGIIGVCMADGDNFMGGELGCRAEAGCAAAMVQMLGGTPQQACDSASMALQCLSALVCNVREGVIMTPAPAPLSLSILAIMYFGDVVFAISGALTAGRYRMDIVGFVLIGTITGIGGGTIRDLLLGRTVWWTQSPEELLLCVAASVITFFLLPGAIARKKWLNWFDALGLASFTVVGCQIALSFGAPFIVAVFMGVVTATGGGVTRDVLTNTQPMILRGQLYATAALAGAIVYGVVFRVFSMPGPIAEMAGFLTAFGLRGASIILDIRIGPPGEFLRIGPDESRQA